MSTSLPKKLLKKILILVFFFLLFPGSIFAQNPCDSIGSNFGNNWDEANLKFFRERLTCDGSSPAGIIITAGDLVNLEAKSGKLMIQHIKDLTDKYKLDVIWRGWGNPQDFDPVLHPEIRNGLKILTGEKFYPGNEQNYCVAESCPGGQPNPQAAALVHKHLLEAGLGIILVIPPLNTQNPSGNQMMLWKEYLDQYSQACPECLKNAQFAAANIYTPANNPGSVDAWAEEAKKYYQYLVDKGFAGKLIITEAGVNPGAYQNFDQKISATLEFAKALEERLKTDFQLAAIIDKLNFFIMNDETGKQYLIHRVCDATGNCKWEIVEYLTYNVMVPGFLPLKEELAPGNCENPKAQEGALRPEKCTACKDPVLDPTYACSQRFEVSQGTYVYVGEDGGGEILACQEGSADGQYYFMRNWGGQITIKTEDTQVEFINYHQKQTDHETKYLAGYLTGTYNRYGADCDWSDPECVKKIFKEAGVLSKLLPKNYQDELRCQMIKKVKAGKEYNYKVWNGRSDTQPITVNSYSATEIPCVRKNYPPEKYEAMEKEWLKTDRGKNWAFIPLVTYKDAPGRLTITSQHNPGTVTPFNFGLSLPHVGTLFEASKILHTTLVPKSLKNQQPPNPSPVSQNNKTLLAEAQTADDLQKELDQSSSWCGYKQTLTDNNYLLSQNNVSTDSGPSSNPYVGLSGSASYDPASSNLNFNVHITNNDAYGFHIETLNFNIDGLNYAYRPGAYTVVDTFLDVGNQDLGLSGLNIREGQTININITLVSKDADPQQIQQTFSLSGSFTLKNGQLITNWNKSWLPIKPVIKKCGNPDGYTPDSCQDNKAKSDSNPNDLICSAPNPIVGQLKVDNYSIVMSAETYQELQNKVDSCKSACEEDENNPKCQKPCSWQLFPGRLSRQIGIKEQLPYFQTIGHWLISDYYRYTDSNGNFDKNPSHQVFGVFDIFRPSNMNHFEPWQAKSSLGYEYNSAYANWDDLQAPTNKPMVVNPSIDRTEGDFYYPWLGGVQWAKKCVSEGLLLPSGMNNNSQCPGFKN
jgi:hypothetical protein